MTIQLEEREGIGLLQHKLCQQKLAVTQETSVQPQQYSHLVKRKYNHQNRLDKLTGLNNGQEKGFKERYVFYIWADEVKEMVPEFKKKKKELKNSPPQLFNFFWVIWWLVIDSKSSRNTT